jgi:hypothetical protein
MIFQQEILSTRYTKLRHFLLLLIDNQLSIFWKRHGLSGIGVHCISLFIVSLFLDVCLKSFAAIWLFPNENEEYYDLFSVHLSDCLFDLLKFSVVTHVWLKWFLLLTKCYFNYFFPLCNWNFLFDISSKQFILIEIMIFSGCYWFRIIWYLFWKRFFNKITSNNWQ